MLVLLLSGAAGVAGETPGLGRQEYTEVHMGMPVRITLYAPAGQGRAAARRAFDRIATLDRMMSDYRPDSELRRLQKRPQAWVGVSAELFDVLTRSAAIASASGGAFDPTIGPVVALWRRARQTGRLPDPAHLEQARALVGWRLVELDPRRRAIRLKEAGMQLDLGGIAKGYILQEALATLREHGAPRALVAGGGDIVAGDAPPDARGWRIDVQGGSPALTARASALTNAALATSGPTAQFVVIDGTRYSHVVDPRTGVGVTNATVAHVIARDGATADAIATALSVLGPENSRPLLARFPGVVVSMHRAKTAEAPRSPARAR
jgi:thiamine biosynthesis lipoprotein